MTIKEQIFYETAKVVLHQYLKLQLRGAMLNDANLIAFLSFPNYAVLSEEQPYRTGCVCARVSPKIEFRIYYDGLNRQLIEEDPYELNIVKVELDNKNV